MLQDRAFHLMQSAVPTRAQGLTPSRQSDTLVHCVFLINLGTAMGAFPPPLFLLNVAIFYRDGDKLINLILMTPLSEMRLGLASLAMQCWAN